MEIKKKNPSKRNFIHEKCNEMLSWLNTCSRPTTAQFRQWKNELESLTSPPNAKRVKHESGSNGVHDAHLSVKVEPYVSDFRVVDAKAVSSTPKIATNDSRNGVTEGRNVLLPIKNEIFEIDDDVVIIVPEEAETIYEIDD